ncbi:MAG: hypothetical protein M1475_03740 [Actinobacteria bacterium]|nr:hypothetical protein [Actinomycetota bacterium]
MKMKKGKVLEVQNQKRMSLSRWDLILTVAQIREKWESEDVQEMQGI